MSYAIIGFGSIGQALAQAFARKNIEVAVASRRPPEALAAQAAAIGPHVVAKSLREALEADDAGQVTRIAHTIKGSAANVSAVGLSAACDTLEQLARAGELTRGRSELPRIEAELDKFFAALDDTLESLKL